MTARGNEYPRVIKPNGKFGDYKVGPLPFHKWVRLYRAELGLTRTKLAERWGVDPKRVYCWDAFTSEPMYNTLIQIFRIESAINPAFDPRVFFEYPYLGPTHERDVRSNELRKSPEWIPDRETDSDRPLGDE